MRIGVLTTSFPRREHDVAGNFVLGLARALATRGHAIEVLAPEPSEGPGPPRWPGIEVRWIPYLRPRRWARTFYGAGVPDNLWREPTAWLGLAPFALALARAARHAARNWDALLSHWALPSACAAAYAREERPHVAILHSADVHLLEHLPARARWATHLARGASTLAFVSEAHRRRFLAVLPASLADATRARTCVQPMGVDAPPSDAIDRETARRALGVERFMLLGVGRLVPVKGFVEASRAFAPRGDLEWWIAGDGPERSALERLARSSRARIRLVGEVHGDQKETLFRAADALVVPSRRLASGRTEGVPTVLAEAMVRGVPVVAARVGALAERVRHGRDGLVVDADDPDALIRAVDRLREDAALRAALGACARESAVRFTWEYVAPRFEAWLAPGAVAPVARDDERDGFASQPASIVV
jgi:glycosyltransferase involved in cell wall biosynthesis